MQNEFPSISTIIPNLVDGQSESWNGLVELFHPGLMGKARRLLRDSRLIRRIDPEELVNIAFTKAWTNHQSLRAQNTRQIAAFLITILKNSFAEMCRPKNLETSSPSWFAPSAGEATPSEMMMSDEEEIQLHAGLAELPENQRIVIVMRHFDGMKFREIAESLGTTTGSVAGLARDGLKKLTDRLGQLDDN